MLKQNLSIWDEPVIWLVNRARDTMHIYYKVTGKGIPENVLT